MPNEIKVSPKRDSFRLALAQLNPVVGDIDGNLRRRGLRGRKLQQRAPI
jgi:predicted amidohydrolase